MAQASKYFWLENSTDNTIKVGLSSTGLDELGKINFIDLPEVGTKLDQDGEFISVEAEKAVTDVASPVTGTIVVINPTLTSSTDDLNDPDEKKRWLMTVANN